MIAASLLISDLYADWKRSGTTGDAFLTSHAEGDTARRKFATSRSVQFT